MAVKTFSVLAGVVAAALSGAAIGAEPSGKDALSPRTAASSAFAPLTPTDDPRDFSGVWLARNYEPNYLQLDGSLPPMNATEAQLRRRRLDEEKANVPIDDAPSRCLPAGAPRVGNAPHPIQFDYAPGVIIILYEVEHNTRFVHMDGRPAPANEPPSFLGYSAGRWEGNTLIVETTRQQRPTDIDKLSPDHGPSLIVTERFSKTKNAAGKIELRDLITFDDPERYPRAWSSERRYELQTDTQIMEYSCEENNRTIGQPKAKP